MVFKDDALISMREANQNFSAAARLADEKGAVVVMRRNKPAYVLIRFDELNTSVPANEDLQFLSPETARKIGDHIITEYHDVFQELAK